MARFHINSKGIPAPCKAEKGNCPFGDVNSHYDTMEKAQEVADKINEEQFGILQRIDSINAYYEIPENTVGEIRIDKDVFLVDNHSLKKSGDVWVHLDENEKVVGTMNEPVIVFKENGELLEVIDNDSEDMRNSITKLRTLNLMSKFGLISNSNNTDSIKLYTPKENINEYKTLDKEEKQKQDINSYNAFSMRIQVKGGNQTSDLFSKDNNEISNYFRKRENLIDSPAIINYDPKFDDWEEVVPSADNFSIEAWQKNNLDIQRINDKWAITDAKGNIYGRLDDPAIAVNFETETIESIGELERIKDECERAKEDTRFTEDDNKMLNRIGMVKVDDKSNDLSHIRNLLSYSWAFREDE